ncbi:MAG: DNA repair protein RecO [Candidatus Latescibacterota bacterium]
MLEKDDGVVLKTARSGETSLLVTFLGRRRGKIRLMAKGVLSPRRRAGGRPAPGSHVEVVYYYKENRSVYYIKEVDTLVAASTSRDSLPHIAVRLAAMELLDQVCYPGSADEAIVDLAVEYVGLEGEDDPLLVFLAFELRLLAALGAYPDLSGCAACGAGVTGGGYDGAGGVAYCPDHSPQIQDALPLTGGQLDAIERCMAGSMAALTGESVDSRTRKQLGKLVHWTYTFHVQGYSLPKSLSLI